MAIGETVIGTDEAEDLFGTEDDDALYGNGGADVLYGYGGNDTLDGGAGADTHIGGAGDDLYYIDNAGDVVLENSGEGTDTVMSLLKKYTLTAHVENLTLLGTAAISGTGNDLDNILTGNSAANVLTGGGGNDTLDGGGGKDKLLGGAGDDLYIVNNTGVTITEKADEGEDTVRASVSFVLGNFIENLELQGSAAINATGNALDNILTGNSGNNTLDGAAGADTMSGGAGNDVYVVDNVGDAVLENAGEGEDTVRSSITYVLPQNVEHLTLTGSGAINGTGNSLNNTLTGNAGANVLDGGDGDDFIDGGAGADTMIGGMGDDSYVVNMVTDVVIEAAGEGSDTVGTYVTYTLPDNVENLVILSASAVNGTGNDLDNILLGGNGVNRLYGLAGNDTLDGGLGNDTLVGGLGDDVYYVNSAGDVVIENADEGADIVISSAVSYTLSAHVEALGLASGAISGKGNAQDNLIVGNDANNTLDGAGGADTLIGGLGDDVYMIHDGTEEIVEELNEGIDTVITALEGYTLADNVENLFLSGTAAISGYGNALNNTLAGNSAINTLAGGLGDDVYVVGAGDVIVENADEGIDTVRASISWTLADNVENLELSAGNGTGNDLDNVMTSTSSAVNTLIGLGGNDTLDGGKGKDVLIGGLGDDTYIINDAKAVVVELEDEGTDTVVSSLKTYTLGDHIENLTLAGTAHINGLGNALANVLTGNSGNNTLNGGAGADTMIGGAGDDVYIVDDAGDVIVEGANAGLDRVLSTAAHYTLSENIEVLTLGGTGDINGTGNSGVNTLIGNAGVNILSGAGGGDTLDGGAGADTLIGGTGDDIYIVDNVNDVVIEEAGEGNDTVRASVSYVLSANVENLYLSAGNGTGNDLGNTIVGSAAVNTLWGLAGNDYLDGGAGNDTMFGGLGDDTFVVNSAQDVVIEEAGEGTDTVISAVSWTLSEHFENLSLSGTAAINAIGNDGDNTLIGNAGANTLDGGAGADTMIGGAGNDTYIVTSAGDVVIEDGTASAGVDTVISSISYTLTDNVERLVLTGVGYISATGNALNNVLTGNSGHNTLDGGSGADTMIGGAGDDLYIVDNIGDVVTEAANGGIDRVHSLVSYKLSNNVEVLRLVGTNSINGTGNALANIISGNDGDNTLDGGAGADTMTGGSGNDTYVVDHIDDVIEETANDGIDTVISSLTWTLADHFENLTLSGTKAINGTGNDLDNILTGNKGKNILTGFAGNDTLIGGGGADTLIGGIGDDTYIVSDAKTLLVENEGEGEDTVISSISWVLGNTLEHLTLSGAGLVNATGNALNNTLIGNASANTLDGGLGADYMAGGAGNDAYIVDDAGDVIEELANAGMDTVYAGVSYALSENVENLVLTGAAVAGTGNTGANSLTGNAGVNTLSGGGGNDWLDGRAGGDTMIGGAGDDWYIVDNADDVIIELDGDGVDTVESSVSIVLSDYVENLILTGTAALNATGNAENNSILGTTGNNTLIGLDGDDILNGNGGNDTLIGGMGNDTYYIDSTSDVIIENVGEGEDTVRSSISYKLGAGLEHLILTVRGTGIINGTGNAENNTLKGNGATNTLIGLDGDDYLDDGGGGGDRMVGGIGNDTYVITDGRSRIVENANEGIDTVIIRAGYASASYSLGSHLENLIIESTYPVVSGNSLNNTITGNLGANTISGGGGNDVIFGMAGNDKITTGSGNDTIDGGEGADTMDGGNGNNVFVVDNVGDVVIGGSGIDLVLSGVSYTASSRVENLTLTGSDNIHATGNALANALTGNSGNNTLIGLAGNDTLDGGDGNDWLSGGAGADILTGGMGADTFFFEAASAFGAVDTITDFSAGDGDVINISDVLFGHYNSGTDSLLDYVLFEDVGGDTVISIDLDGAGTAYAFRQVAVLSDVTGLDAEALVASGNLVVG